MQNFSYLVQEEHFSNWGLNGGRQENVRFWTGNWPYLGNGERYGQGYY